MDATPAPPRIQRGPPVDPDCACKNDAAPRLSTPAAVLLQQALRAPDVSLPRWGNRIPSKDERAAKGLKTKSLSP